MAKKDPIQHLREELQKGISRAWEGLTEGWREILTRGNGALTYFVRPTARGKPAVSDAPFPRWGLLAAEAWETAHAVIVRLELPGLKKEDLDVSIDRGSLRVRGDRPSTAVREGRTYHLMERAFGRFERTIGLPDDIDTKRAELAYEDGVLTVIVPKTKPSPPTHLPIS